MLLYLLDVQRELCGRLGDGGSSGGGGAGGGGGGGGGGARLDAARHLGAALSLLVAAASEVPSGAYEKLVAARETLQALQGQGGQAGSRGGGRVYGALPPRPASPPAAPPAALPAAPLVTATPAAPGGTAGRAAPVTSAPGPLGAAEPVGSHLANEQPSTRSRLPDQEDQAEEEKLLLSFVIDKVAAGSSLFKVNKLHQVRGKVKVRWAVGGGHGQRHWVSGIGHRALGIRDWALGRSGIRCTTAPLKWRCSARGSL